MAKTTGLSQEQRRVLSELGKMGAAARVKATTAKQRRAWALEGVKRTNEIKAQKRKAKEGRPG